MEFGVLGNSTTVEVGVVPAVTLNIALVQSNAFPQSVVAAHAVGVGGLVCVTLTAIAPNACVSELGSTPLLANTGRLGSIPMLQLGGEHEALMAAPPANVFAVTVPDETVAKFGSLVFHVNGGLETTLPRVSTAVAEMVLVLAAARSNELPVPDSSCSRM